MYHYFLIASVSVLSILYVAACLWNIADKSRYRKQSAQQRLEAHSVEIEAQDGGGYSVVE